MLDESRMFSLAEKAVTLGIKRGADEVEAYVSSGASTSVAIERGQIAKTSKLVDSGLGVRIIANKATGFSYTNMLENEKAIEETVSKALIFANSSKRDEDWQNLPAEGKFVSTKGTYDDKIALLHSEDLVELTYSMLNAALETDRRVFPVEGGMGAGYWSVVVANSNRLAIAERGTIVECSLATIGQDGKDVTPVCFEFDMERTHDVNPEWVGREAARLAVSALEAKKTETKTVNAIFTQYALQQLLHFTLINAVKADYVQRNQSALKGKIGEKIASENVTICDDGLLNGGIRTAKFDGEGVPQQKTIIVDEGVLRSFIYDNYTAKKEGKESTGNASRMGYLSTPSIDATNFHVLAGNKSVDDLMSEVDEGILIYSVQGAHSSNPASGDFSVVATPAWKIRRGQIEHAIKGAMVAGNIFELLKNISDLADNERKIGQLVAPWVLAENVKVIGK